jgi:hypothetical protein
MKYLEGMVEAEVSRGVRPVAETKDVTKRGATCKRGGSGNRPGRRWRLDASLDETKLEAAFEGCGVQWLVRKSAAEKEGTVLQMQAVSFQQNECYGLHRADTQIFLPRLDVEGGGKMTWTVCLGEAGGNKTKVFPLPPEVIVVAQEGHKSSDGLLAVVRAIRKAPFRMRLERGKSTGQC